MAIARDSSAQAQSGAGVTSLTFAHNNVAGNIMWMSAYSNSGSDNFTSAAFNGTNGTKVGSSVLNADGTYTTVWYLASPATGTNNVVLTRSGSSARIGGASVSYTDASTTGIPDANTTNTGAGANLTTSVTTIADNCWTILFAHADDGTDAAGTGSTFVNGPSGILNSPSIYDSNGAVTPAGNKSMQVTGDGSSNFSTIMVSFKPAGGSPPAATPLLSLMGVGM